MDLRGLATNIICSFGGRRGDRGTSGRAPTSVEIRPLLALVVEEGRCGHLPPRPRMAHELPRFVESALATPI